MSKVVYGGGFTSIKRAEHLSDVTRVWFPYLEALLAKRTVRNAPFLLFAYRTSTTGQNTLCW